MGGPPAVKWPDTQDEDRPLRIRLPVEYHLRLHRLRLYSGQTMAQVVRRALDVHLADEEARLVNQRGERTIPEALPPRSAGRN